MSRPRTNFKPDILARTLTAPLAGIGVTATTEEVVRTLGSGVKPRTRDRIEKIEPQEREGGVISLRVVLKPGPWTGYEQLDLEDALACV